MNPWVITFRGQRWSSAEATTAHAVAVAELIGDDWAAVSPWSGPRALAAWIAVLMAGSLAVELDAAIAAVYALPLDELAGCIDRPDEDGASASQEAPVAVPI